MGIQGNQRKCHCTGIHGDGQHNRVASGPCPQPSASGTDSRGPMGRAQGYCGCGAIPVFLGERLCAWSRAGGGRRLAGTLRIKCLYPSNKKEVAVGTCSVWEKRCCALIRANTGGGLYSRGGLQGGASAIEDSRVIDAFTPCRENYPT